MPSDDDWSDALAWLAALVYLVTTVSAEVIWQDSDLLSKLEAHVVTTFAIYGGLKVLGQRRRDR